MIHCLQKTYIEFLESNDKKLFRLEHAAQIQSYKEARAQLKEIYPDGNILPLKDLKETKAELKYHKNCCKELQIADANVSIILDTKIPEKQKSHENEL